MTKRTTTPLRFVIWAVLLGLGFFGGIAWKSADDPSDPETVKASTEAATEKEDTEDTSYLSPDLKESELATIELFENATPSVCFITTSDYRRDFFTMNVTETPRGSGSGFVWDSDGHIVTNYHVIAGADRAQVTLADQTTWDAALVGGAPEKDIAVLKIEAPTEGLIPIPVGSSERLRVGQSVYAIGNPFGLDQTLTTGIVSALGREIQSQTGTPIRDVIQTDAAINPGNSGGPLLNSSGQLIGVNTAIYSPSGASAGIGFSIPVDAVKWIVPELIAYGKIKRPTLGVQLATPAIARRLRLSEGVLVLDVLEGSAAEQAGLQPTLVNRRGRVQLGDIIIGINDDAIKSYGDLQLSLEKYQAGELVTLKIIREENEQEVALRLDEAR